MRSKINSLVGRHMRGVDLLEAKLSGKFLLRQRVQLARDKESSLLNQGVNLSEVDSSGERCINFLFFHDCRFLPGRLVKNDAQFRIFTFQDFTKEDGNLRSAPSDSSISLWSMRIAQQHSENSAAAQPLM